MHRLATGFLAFSVFAAAETATPPWNLAHPDATALIGLDLRTIRASEAGKQLGAQMQKASFGMLNFPGMEILSDIDQVFLSSPGAKTVSPKAASVKPAGPASKIKENPPFLIVLTGHFTAEHVGVLLRGVHRDYHGINIYPPSPAGNASMALLDTSTLLIGDAASLEGAIERSKPGLHTRNPLAERASELAAANDFWIIATAPPSAFQPANVDLGKFASDIRGIEAGFAFREGFNLELSLMTKDTEAAHELAQLLSGQLQLAMLSQLDNQQATELARKLQVTSEGSRMRVTLALSKEEMDRQIQLMQTARTAGPAPKPAPKAEPPSSHPGTVRIYGLDDGVREIPVGPVR
jgi:hypothetical protein